LNGVTGLCMTPLNFVVICSVPIAAQRDGGGAQVAVSVAKGKHAWRLLAAGAGKAQSEFGSNNNAGRTPDSAKGGLQCRMAFDRAKRLRLPSLP
jgi:hypothetical protein